MPYLCVESVDRTLLAGVGVVVIVSRNPLKILMIVVSWYFFMPLWEAVLSRGMVRWLI
jgi:hypothetical protein